MSGPPPSPSKAKMKRVLPNVPKNRLEEKSGRFSPGMKTVTFNSEIIETSIGGTQSYGHIKCDPLSPCNGCEYHTSKCVKKSSQISADVDMPENDNLIESEVKVAVTTESSANTEKMETEKTGSNTHGNEKRSVQTSRPQSENNDPSRKKGDSMMGRKSGKDQGPDGFTPSRRVKNMLRSKTLSSCALGDVPVTSISPPTKHSNLLNLHPMGDSPTKIPVLARRTFQSFPDGQSPTATRENSASHKDTSLRQSPVLDARTSAHSFPFTASHNLTPVRRHTLEKLPPTPECYNKVNFESYRTGLGSSNDSLMETDELSECENGGGSCSVTVAVRVRPFSQRELSDNNVRCVVGMTDNETVVTSDNGQTHPFCYDFSFWSFDDEHGDFASQEYVYTSLAQPLLGKAFEGYNTCLFAYGQTGSGKSYSIMGHGNEAGIIPRFSEELFARMETATSVQPVKMNVEISFFEIYNEKIHDLLASSKEKTGKKALKVREHPVLGPYVEGLSTFVVNSFEDIQGWITLGNKSRATAATGMNDKSSRSHSVFTLVLTQTKSEYLEGQNHDHSITSKINLVDLAGSERQTTAQTSGERLREGANINKSLMTLGKVISLLCERSINKRRKLFIPYRDSVLTWLLKESLGGNSKTAMIATISPANHHIEETLSTLRYAKQARSIVNNVRVNEDPKARLIKQLRAEIDKLRSQTGVTSEVVQASSLAEIASLKEKLAVKEKEMEEASRSWKDKLQRSVARKEEELKTLEKAGVSFKVDNKLPNLVNLNEDPQLSEMLLYVIKEGTTRVGRRVDGSTHDIQLTGALIADDHCVINNEKEEVSLSPNREAPTYINGNLITETCVLHHGDRVILGGDHYFRFNHPIEVQCQKKTSGGTEVKDFEFAKQELMRVQESRLQAELEEAKRVAQEEMSVELEKIKKEAEEEFNAQKTGYEGKLANLQNSLQSQKEKLEEAQKEAAELQKQKMLLEQEVLAGKKKQQLEQKPTNFDFVDWKRYEGVDWKRSKILDLLQAEKEKLTKKLEEAKQRTQKRLEMPPPSKKQKMASVDFGKTDLYKTALLLSEANRISQHLKKHTTFSRQDIFESEEMKTFVKVTNTKLNICTYWPLPKFEEKLLSMRELYQGEGDNSTVDEVFHDATDNWEKETGFNSPRCSRKSRRSSSGRRLSLLGSPLLNSTRLNSSSSQRSESTTDVGCAVSFAALARSVLNLSIDKRKDVQSQSESIADEVLIHAETLKMAVTTIMDAPMATKNSSTDPSDTDSASCHMVQLLTSYQVLLSHASLWSSLYRAVDSPLILDLTEKISEVVKELGNHMGLFLQGCENEIESMVQEFGTKVLDCLYCLCKNCGELALATDTPMATLYPSPQEDVSSDEDTTNTVKLCPAICQAFLGGCDVFVDKTLQGGIRTLEDCEVKVQACSEELTKSAPALSVVPVHVEVVMGTSRVLLEKCQEIQVEVDNSMMDTSETKPAQFYQHSYSRSQRLVSNISCLVDAVNLIMNTTESIAQDSDTDLRKICRCADLIQKAAVKLLAVSKKDSFTGPLPSGSSQSDLLDVSVLSDSQVDQLGVFIQEVKVAANTLTEKVQQVMDSDWSKLTPGRGKRILPASPDRVSAPVSVLQAKNRTLWKSASLVDEQK